MFNIYYLNYNKAFEISMLKSNEIVDSKEQSHNETYQSSNTTGLSAQGETKFGNSVLGRVQAALKGSFELSNEEGTVKSINHSIRVIHSNSILLENILNISKDAKIKELNKNEEGELIKLDKLRLYILNEENVRAAKAMKPGSIKDIDGLKVEGMTLNADKLLSSMLSDYFYLLCCDITDKEGLLFKIPLNDEFESSYSVDDILIGSISLIGVYKGVVNKSELTNTFDFFQNVGESEEKITENFEHSSYADTNINRKKNDLEKSNIEKFHFIDTIAVLQDIKIKDNERPVK